MEDKYSKVRHFTPVVRVIGLIFLVTVLAIVVVRWANHRRTKNDQAQKAGQNSQVASNTTNKNAAENRSADTSDDIPGGIDDQRSSSNGQSMTVPSAGISFPLVSLLSFMTGTYVVIFIAQNRHKQVRR